MKNNMELTVQFLAGTSVTEAVTDAKNKAELFGLAYVKFDFNGTSFAIGRDADVIGVETEYRFASEESGSTWDFSKEVFPTYVGMNRTSVK